MNSSEKPARKLADLGVSQPAQVAPLFAEVRARFDEQAYRALDDHGWAMMRQSWLGRKSGVLTLITENWLKPSPSELKRVVGHELNQLRAHVESQIEARRAAIESSAQQSTLASERVDLSLPGVTRPIGSHHLIHQVFQHLEDI